MGKGRSVGVAALAMYSANDYRRAGVSRYCHALFDEWARRDLPFEPHVFHSQGFKVPPAWRPSLTMHAVDMRRWKKKVLWETIGSMRASRHVGADVWMATAHALPFKSRCKRVIMVHDLFPITHPEWFQSAYPRFIRFALSQAIRSADMVLANSEATRASVLSCFPRDPESVRVTPLGPGNDVARVEEGDVPDALLEKYGLDASRQYVITLGTLEPRKNLARLIEAMASVRGSVDLAIAGGRGWKDSAIFETVERLGLQDRVRFTGYVDDADLPGLMARARAFVLPSLDEGFGIPVLEGMLFGTPVLCSNRPALVEVAGEAALTFDPMDVASIARCVETSLDGGDRGEMIRAGLERSRLFTWKRTADATIAALESL